MKKYQTLSFSFVVEDGKITDNDMLKIFDDFTEILQSKGFISPLDYDVRKSTDKEVQHFKYSFGDFTK